MCEADKNFDFVHDAIKIMKSKFEDYWIKILDKALICFILDPRFKTQYIDCRLLKKNLIRSIQVKLNRVRLQIWKKRKIIDINRAYDFEDYQYKRK
ncbi:hypothetical protein BpHYR1_053167 [Brachionus plicatilis]|uniref:hAT-like transposase RNase-H fold domain-containing protein n=1 Tax=Brachionus plicatilis TaxID=10195 RepID=A0A3M7QMW1_BRAPC|nr:hypothetical protein BpHYR1_053167 [Brachionus plicatilis]